MKTLCCSDVYFHVSVSVLFVDYVLALLLYNLGDFHFEKIVWKIHYICWPK